MHVSRGFLVLPLLFLCFTCADQTSDTVHLQITAQVPEGTPAVYLAGNLDALGPWRPDGLRMEGSGTERTAEVEVPTGYTFEYKFTLGTWPRQAVDADGNNLPNYRTVATNENASITQTVTDFAPDPITYLEDWQGSGVQGQLVYWSDVASAHLEAPRHVGIWLPPDYDANADTSYRVLYMHDGQNLFDPRLSGGSIDWGVDEAMMQGVEAGLFEPAIVVGVFNSDRRLQEYSPWHDAPKYASFLLEELMPRVNAEFRTLTGPEHTFVMGSSMGGLLSFYLVKNHPDVFGACGCVSSHFILSDAVYTQYTTNTTGGDPTPYLLQDIAAGDQMPSSVRAFFDYGTVGLDSLYAPQHEALHTWLLDQDLTEGRDFIVRVYEGADHNEASWRARMDDQLAWLLAETTP